MIGPLLSTPKKYHQETWEITGIHSVNYWIRSSYNGGRERKTTLFGGGVRVLWWSDTTSNP